MLELNKIYNMDCLEGMKQLDDNSIDLIIADPPYGIGESVKQRHKNAESCKTWKKRHLKWKGYNKKEWDVNLIDKEYFDEMFRVSKNQIIFGGNYYVDYLYNSSCWIVWDKKNGKTDYSDCELAWTSFNTAVRKFEWLWSGYKKQVPEKKHHPTQKPLALIEWCISNYSKENDIVCDPFCGSGTTAVACKRLDRRFIGFEIDNEYYNVSLKRLLNQPERLDKWMKG